MKLLRKAIARFKAPDSRKLLQKRLDVQFFGHSGVGKTTLSNVASAQSSFQWKSARRCDFITQGYFFDKDEVFNVYREIMKRKFSHLLNSKVPVVIISKKIESHSKMAIWDMHLREDISSAYWEDDGIITRFHDSLIAMANDGVDLKYFFHNRVYVHVYASVERVIENIERRAVETGRFRANNFGWLSESGIRDYIPAEMERYEKLAVLLKESGYPIINIDAEVDLKIQATAVAKFVDNIVAEVDSMK